MVLTEAGLAGILTAVKQGRPIFQRILTYTLNSIIKKIVIVLLLIASPIMTGHAVLMPFPMAIPLISGDVLPMSLTTDNVRPPPAPNAWRIGDFTLAGGGMAVGLLAFCAKVLAWGTFALHVDSAALRSPVFVSLVFGSQATIYAIRQRRHLWGARPGVWLAVSPAAFVFAFVLDKVKVPLFVRLRIVWRARKWRLRSVATKPRPYPPRRRG